MYNQDLVNLLFGQRRYDDSCCHQPRVVRPKPVCQCCYCQSQRQVVQPQVVQPQVNVTPTTNYTSQAADFLVTLLTKYKEASSSDDYSLYFNGFKQYLKLFNEDEQKNEILAESICQWMGLSKHVHIPTVNIPVKEEVKVDSQSLVDQIYKTFTGQPIAPEVSDLIQKIVANKQEGLHKVNTEKINSVMNDIIKMINKKPELPKEHADSILNEFLKCDKPSDC